ncbi:MAG: hypothetical protein AAF318_16510 [Pseudomonadota bacterium]
MRTDLTDPEDGTPILEYIASFGSDPDDFEWFTFPAHGEETFGLSGADLDEFVARCVTACLANGCVPVDGHRDGKWVPTYAYGITDDEIAWNMVRAWHALDGRQTEFGELFFSWKDWIGKDDYAEWTRRREAAR